MFSKREKNIVVIAVFCQIFVLASGIFWISQYQADNSTCSHLHCIISYVRNNLTLLSMKRLICVNPLLVL